MTYRQIISDEEEKEASLAELKYKVRQAYYKVKELADSLQETDPHVEWFLTVYSQCQKFKCAADVYSHLLALADFILSAGGQSV